MSRACLVQIFTTSHVAFARSIFFVPMAVTAQFPRAWRDPATPWAQKAPTTLSFHSKAPKRVLRSGENPPSFSGSATFLVLQTGVPRLQLYDGLTPRSDLVYFSVTSTPNSKGRGQGRAGRAGLFHEEV
jgi:hypothetical protein